MQEVRRHITSLQDCFSFCFITDKKQINSELKNAIEHKELRREELLKEGKNELAQETWEQLIQLRKQL